MKLSCVLLVSYCALMIVLLGFERSLKPWDSYFLSETHNRRLNGQYPAKINELRFYCFLVILPNDPKYTSKLDKKIQ